MARCGVIFVWLTFVTVLSLSEITCQTAETDEVPSSLYPTIKLGCDYRKRKEALRKKLQAEVAAKFEADNKFKDKISENLLRFLTNDRDKMIDACLRDAYIIGGDEGDYYKIWCDLFNYHVSLPGFTPSLTFFKRPYQHMAVLGWRRTNNTISWHCGATLIHKDFVLTAAHCIFNIGEPPNLVRTHETNLLRGGPDTEAVDYDIEKIVTHEQYNTLEYYNDIALIKIKRQAAFENIQPPLPACIWTKEDYPMTNYTVLGFGAPSFGQEYVLVLKIHNLTLFDRVECSKYFEEIDELPKGVLDTQICASDPTGLADTCEGDSGGPLQFTLSDESQTPFLIGITSFGRQCHSGNPGVYTRIYGFLDWIEKNLKEMM